MKESAILLFLLVGIAYMHGATGEEIADSEWHSWKSLHGKQYEDIHEENLRYTIWQDNKRYVEEYNIKNEKMKLGMNQFGDLTNNEFRTQMNGYLNERITTRSGSTFTKPNHVRLPTEVDWRKEGYVTPVKDQRMCGSCWAFSTTGSLEGQHFKATGKLVNLSEQQLIECSWSYGNNGCQGGLMDNAFKYLVKSNGLDTEKSYPYTALESPFCEFNPSTVGATMTNYMDIKTGDEKALQQAVATVGPISVAIDAGHKSFQLYKSGVYDEPDCNSQILDHGVLVVGYGTDNNDAYWLVKNSWNTTWGMDGYIQMSRNKSNQCGIATKASYPVV